MNRYRLFRYTICFSLLFAVIVGLAGSQDLFAAQVGDSDEVLLSPAQDESADEEDEEVELSIYLDCKYPIVIGESGEIFSFDVTIRYEGDERRKFDLTTTVPDGWGAVVIGGTESKEILSLELAPYGTVTGDVETVNVIFGPLIYYPEPGNYECILEISSGDDLKDTLKLAAMVSDWFEFTVTSGLEDGDVNPEVTAGKEYHMPVLLENAGSADIENITFASEMPEGWVINYNPAEIGLLEAGLTQEIDAVITAPKEADDGDYIVTLKPESEEYYPEPLVLRVKVERATLWGGAGIAIVVAVVAGLAFMFKRLGKW